MKEIVHTESHSNELHSPENEMAAAGPQETSTIDVAVMPWTKEQHEQFESKNECLCAQNGKVKGGPDFITAHIFIYFPTFHILVFVDPGET